MLSLIHFTTFFSAAALLSLLSPSLHAIRSPHLLRPSFRRSPPFLNSPHCPPTLNNTHCSPNLLHIAITLDSHYLRGSFAAVHSVLQHASCSQNIFFHFLVSDNTFNHLIHSTFPNLKYKVHHFNPNLVRTLISTSVRQELEQPLNYARNYLADILDPCIRRVIYLDSDVIVVDDIRKLWMTNLGDRTIGAPEYCHANFTNYFTSRFWSDKMLSGVFAGRQPCYFNTGVMVMDLERWRRFGYTRRIVRWMEVQRGAAGDGGGRIYELGSLPPFLLVFAGRVAGIEHRWNQHGLGGDNVRGSCRDLHPGPVSLLHWSGSGKPWVRIDSNRPCPLDALWAPYDLYAE